MFRPYSERAIFVVCSNQKVLKQTVDLKESRRRLARWKICVLEFDDEVRHRLSIHHQTPLASSRLSKKEDEEELSPIDVHIPVVDVQIIDSSYGARFMSLNQNSASVPTKAGRIEALCRNPYCQNDRSAVDIYQTWLLDKNCLL